MLNGRALKVTCLLDPAEISALSASDRQPRTLLRIKVGDRKVSADVASKSVRKVQSTLREHGADACVVLVQGTLSRDDVIEGCGLVAQVTVKPAEEAAPAPLPPKRAEPPMTRPFMDAPGPN